jgi:hypothetical protein
MAVHGSFRYLFVVGVSASAVWRGKFKVEARLKLPRKKLKDFWKMRSKAANAVAAFAAFDRLACNDKYTNTTTLINHHAA